MTIAVFVGVTTGLTKRGSRYHDEGNSCHSLGDDVIGAFDHANGLAALPMRLVGKATNGLGAQPSLRVIGCRCLGDSTGISLP